MESITKIDTNVPINYITRKNMKSRYYDMCCNSEKLFRRAMKKGFDPEDFIKKFMNSDYCLYELDCPYSPQQLAWEGEELSNVLEEIHPKKAAATVSEDIVGYAGHIYRYLQMRLGKELIIGPIADDRLYKAMGGFQSNDIDHIVLSEGYDAYLCIQNQQQTRLETD